MFAHCQHDAFARSLTTEVVSCVKEDGRFVAILRDTVLYPEGGGQPSDTGTVNGVSVTHVEARDDGPFAHWVESQIEPGPAVVLVDWDNRYQHMQQHTAQHVITAIALDRLGMATVGFHLGAELSTIDLETPSLSESQLQQLEHSANLEVTAARPVSVRFVEPEEYGQLNVRSRGLPAGHAGTIRLVEIAGLDVNTCGGTHVASTAELQVVAFLGTEKLRGNVRLKYVAGERARKRWVQSHDRERTMTKLLECRPEDHVDGLEKIVAARNSLQRQKNRLEEELAKLLGEKLAATPEAVAALHRDDTDFGFLNRVSRAAHDLRPDLLVLLTTGSSQEQMKNRSGLFLMTGPPDAVSELGPVVAEVLEGRGGGAKGRYQGKAQRLENLEDAIQFLQTRRS